MEDVENAVFNMEQKEVSSAVIGELVMDRLKKLDQVAYVRFASVYREFKDVKSHLWRNWQNYLNNYVLTF